VVAAFQIEAATKLNHTFFSLTKIEDLIMELDLENLLFLLVFLTLIMAFYILKNE